MWSSSYVQSLYARVSDPFAAVFGNESFGGGFADFSALTKVILKLVLLCFIYTALKLDKWSVTYYGTRK